MTTPQTAPVQSEEGLFAAQHAGDDRKPFWKLSPMQRRWSIDARQSTSAPGTPTGTERRGSEMMAYFDLPHIAEEPTSATKNNRVIAIDFDDVVSQCNRTLIEFHNKYFGTELTIDDWQSYYIYRNKGWGTLEETERKLTMFNSEIHFTPHMPPVPDVRAALQRIRDMGHPCHIVTARSWKQRDMVVDWLKRHDLYHLLADIHFVGAFDFVDKVMEEAPTDDLNGELLKAMRRNVGKKHKIKILHAIKAELLIDDHFSNVDACATADPPIKSLLFGPYAWNRTRWGMGSDTPQDHMTYQERIDAGHYDYVDKLNDNRLLDGTARAQDWGEVLRFVEAWDAEAAREQANNAEREQVA